MSVQRRSDDRKCQKRRNNVLDSYWTSKLSLELAAIAFRLGENTTGPWQVKRPLRHSTYGRGTVRPFPGPSVKRARSLS